MDNEWFRVWFDSPYYHILYKHRDDKEAQAFMQKLTLYLNIQSEHRLLDMACGKGRHSIYLNNLGFEVVGIDLAPANIAYAKQFENQRLSFAVQDIREVYQSEAFDFAFNLFTSFGYFETIEENQKAIIAMVANLKVGGIMVIDFFNTYKVLEELPTSHIKNVEGIEFHIYKRQEEKFIYKDISFQDQGQNYEYHERIMAISRKDFAEYFNNAGVEVINLLGNYNLEPFDQKSSDRMIWIVRKTKP